MAGYCIEAQSKNWEPIGSACAKETEFAARRSESGGPAKDSLDSKSSKYFIDVGCWQGGEDGRPKTTYAVVCGQDAMLCDWLGFRYPRTRTSYTPPIGKPEAKLSQFLEACQKQARGGAIGWVRAPKAKPFTKPDDLLLVVPDLHIHLFKNHLVDRFVYRPEPGMKQDGVIFTRGAAVPKYSYRSEIASLNDEMGKFLTLARDAGATIIQIGDMYEVWESEMLLRTIYLGLLDHVHDWFEDRFNIHNPTPDLVRPEFERAYPDSAVKRMIVTGKVIPNEPGETMEDYIRKMAAIQWLPHIEKSAVDFSSTEAICHAIEKRYPSALKDGNFDVRLWGNHDNSQENPYWAEAFVTAGVVQRQWTQHGCDMYGKLRTKTKAWKHSQKKEFVYPAAGGPASVWIEHGHYYDWHNCDDDWWKQDHGFDTVFRGPLGKSFGTGYIDLKTSLSRSGTEAVLELADDIVDFSDYEMRLPELRRTDAIGGHAYEDKYRGPDEDPLRGKKPEERPQLVIMGHTHGPAIIECPVNIPFRQVNPAMIRQFNNYVYGDYFYRPGWKPGGKEELQQDQMSKARAMMRPG